MEWYIAIGFLFSTLFLLMLSGLPVVFAFFCVNIMGAFVFLGGGFGLIQMARNSAEAINSFSLVPVPLFILMGELLFHTGLAQRTISAIERLISAVPGRLSIVSVLGGTAFATLSGSSIANTAMMGSSLLPEMTRKGYHPTMAMGPILAVGGIAILIPPSALAVTLASLGGISISKLLIAGVVPGIMIGVVTLLYVIVRCAINPALAPCDHDLKNQTGSKWVPFLKDVVPLFIIFFAVVGSLVFGLASPTESAAFGVVSALVAAFLYKSINFNKIYVALAETAKLSASILFILVASTTFSQILSFSGATTGLLEAVSNLQLTSIHLVILMLLTLLVLGCFVDQISMIMLTLPFFIPLVHTTGIDLVWFGVLVLIAMEISLLTPPFGLLLLIMQGVAPKSTKLTQVYAAALPFVGLQIAVLIAVLAFPNIISILQVPN